MCKRPLSNRTFRTYSLVCRSSHTSDVCHACVSVQDTSQTQYVYPVGWPDRVRFITHILRLFDSTLRSNNVEFVATVVVETDSKTKRIPTHTQIKKKFFNTILYNNYSYYIMKILCLYEILLRTVVRESQD